MSTNESQPLIGTKLDSASSPHQGRSNSEAEMVSPVESIQSESTLSQPETTDSQTDSLDDIWGDCFGPMASSPPPPSLGKLIEADDGQECRPPVYEMNAEDVRAIGADGDGLALDFLPFLDLEGYIVRGWSHLIAGYPKAGKTELLTRLCLRWKAERILYITEEPEGVWAARLASLPGYCAHIRLAFALGAGPKDIEDRIKKGDETVVVIDTVRNLLSIRDEIDNSEVARVLNPLIASCRGNRKTLLLVHHLRKGGGERGEGITGGHAFLGVVDVALEVGFPDGNVQNRRRIRGWGRILSVEELIYERAGDGAFTALGAPGAVARGRVKECCTELMTDKWQTARQIRDALPEPKPSEEQVRLALNELYDDGLVERDPQEPKPGKTYRYCRVGSQTSPPTIGGPVGGEVLEAAQEPLLVEALS